ncbi:MAG: NAD(P)-dependent oxidoreductase [Chloroflexota bacterium]
MSNSKPKLGLIGLGNMGGAMARNLLEADYRLHVYDLDTEAVADCVSKGGITTANTTDLVRQSDIVLTSLPSSSVFVGVAEESFISNAKPDQVFIDLGTTEGEDTRRIAQAIAEKGATLLDAPVSGGPAGATSGNLRIFVGGEKDIFNQCKPILDILGEPEHVVYCGASGSGQTVKGVNQLAMGLGTTAYLEAIAYGVRAGINPKAIHQAVGGSIGWRHDIAQITQRIQDERVETMVVKFPELPYFLAEANEQGITLPLTEALFEFLDQEPRRWRDNMNRPTVSFWHTLLNHEREQS